MKKECYACQHKGSDVRSREGGVFIIPKCHERLPMRNDGFECKGYIPEEDETDETGTD